MTTVSVREAKTHLSRLLAAVERGEDVVIARSGQPVARLVALSSQPKGKRPLGRLRGQAAIADPHFAADEVRRQFEGS
ncbi:MAG: type II toxin-antitoxin system prevent-host-death family antitoxin [Bifidobacteriaceae bacterium]|nr:type II toxin-antitoxin system prevent-host-death family antitoxin [Bifidobacteriaceae bacterium]